VALPDPGETFREPSLPCTNATISQVQHANRLQTTLKVHEETVTNLPHSLHE
jgi:hypothetical protein